MLMFDVDVVNGRAVKGVLVTLSRRQRGFLPCHPHHRSIICIVLIPQGDFDPLSSLLDVQPPTQLR